MAKKKVVGKNKHWGIILHSLKTYYKATVNNIIFKYQEREQWNRETEIESQIYIYTINFWQRCEDN